LGYRGVPLMARSTFRHELQSETVGCFGAALLTPPLLQAFAKQALHAPDVLLPLFFIGTIAGNLLASLVTQFFQRRRRVPYVVAARLGMGGALGVMALLPANQAMLLPFTAVILGAAILGQIVLSIASSVWHTNYPRSIRGSIWSRLTVFKLLAIAIGVQLAGIALDAWPWAHHLVFALGGGCFCLSAALYSRIRVRRERKLLADAHDAAEPIRLLSGLRLLRDDPHFLRYMILQFASGSMNLMLTGGMLYLAMHDVFAVDYKEVAGAFVFIPSVIHLLSSPLAGALFDRMNIMTYRVFSSTVWGIHYAVLFLGLWLASWPLVLTGFTIRGLAEAGGAVAWNIGHTRFAAAHRSQLYMGVHMTLTGIRGMFMPFVGVLLYRGIHWPALGIDWSGLGLWTVAVGFVVIFASGLGFAIVPRPAPPED
jgi:hypothetical protein